MAGSYEPSSSVEDCLRYPKDELDDYEPRSFSHPDNVPSSSGTNLRSSFIGMGFSLSLIDRVIKEKGEENHELLLDTLFAYSVPQVAKSVSSDSLDSLLDEEKDVEQSTISADIHPKQEADLMDDDKRTTLLMMKFSADKVDFAISKLGNCAPIDELVDFIMAAEIAESEKGDELANGGLVETNEDSTAEGLFGTMDKTLQLLKMGFNEQDVSLAIEKLGSRVPMPELANWICARQMGESYSIDAKQGFPGMFGDGVTVKTEAFGIGYPSQTRGPMHGYMTPKEEYLGGSNTFFDDFNMHDIKGKRPKEEYEEDFSSTKKKKSKSINIGGPLSSPGDSFGVPKAPNPNANKSLDNMVSGPPYFVYGNVISLSNDTWKKVSQFCYNIEPEFVYTQFLSALNRKEGYIHNLPSDERFPIQPKSPMTIEEVVPHTKKWWPTWDSRKHVSFINSQVSEISQICTNLEKILKDSRGVVSHEQQTKILHYCRKFNLVWVAARKLAPLEPEYIERVLGYPMNHTRNPDLSIPERLESMRNCFQTDTLGYYLSVLKSRYPGGMTLLSLYSGIGGAEVTLHRLGIYLKGVVSVESSESKRRILRRWWQNTDQSGELVQIDDIQKLTSNKLEYLMNKLGGFDLVICHSPSTYSPKNTTSNPVSSDVEGLDFSLFHEFVRVVQRVRTMSRRT